MLKQHPTLHILFSFILFFVSCKLSMADRAITITIDDTKTYQKMDGFGASLTDSSAWLISKSMKPDQREKLLHDLFDPATGIGLSYLRQPMGSSDFRTRDYTYDDMPVGQSDLKLIHFTVAKDKEYILPLLKKILAINPHLKIMATPWSPPEWMKANDHLKKDAAIYNSYADYFVRYLQAYAAAGVPVDAVTLQNEPMNIQHSYYSMGMDPQDQIRLVKLLGPKLRAAKLKTKIIVWDHNWDHPEFPINVLKDASARSYIDGSAFHGYGGNVSAQSKVHDAYPDKNLYFTECSGGDWAKDFASNLMWDMENLVVGAPRNWAKTVVKWNLALNEKNGPKLPGGADNCRGVVTIHEKTGEVTKEVEFYALGHAAKFIQPGSRRVFSDLPNTLACLNPDRSLALIVFNKSHQPQQYTIQWLRQSYTYTLPGQSAATFLIKAQNSISASVWLTTGDKKNLLSRQPDITLNKR